MIKRPRLKGGIIETLRKKLRLRLVLCSRKQDFKENPPGWKKLPPETPRQPHPITPISAIFVFFLLSLLRRRYVSDGFRCGGKETEIEYLKRKIYFLFLLFFLTTQNLLVFAFFCFYLLKLKSNQLNNSSLAPILFLLLPSFSSFCRYILQSF